MKNAGLREIKNRSGTLKLVEVLLLRDKEGRHTKNISVKVVGK
jgi:hypothetical protein